MFTGPVRRARARPHGFERELYTSSDLHKVYSGGTKREEEEQETVEVEAQEEREGEDEERKWKWKWCRSKGGSTRRAGR